MILLLLLLVASLISSNGYYHAYSDATTCRYHTKKLHDIRNGKEVVMTPTELHIERVRSAIVKNSKLIIDGLSTKRYAVVDNLLGNDILEEMRKEAEVLYKNGNMIISQSTKYDKASGEVISYDKKNVYSCQLMGSDMYFHAPRLHEYIYSLSKTMIPLINSNFKLASLSNTMSSTKLAVCTGDGSRYDKHYDNTGTDTRKLTILY